MKKALTIICIICLFFACNDRETDYEYNPSLDFAMAFEDTPIFEDDILKLTITIQQEDGEDFGKYAIKLQQDSTIGKVNFENGKEITKEWTEISYGTTTLNFKGIAKGDYPLTIRIKDPYGKEIEKSYTLKVISKGIYLPFTNSYFFVKQQLKDIWGQEEPTAQQISFWQKKLDSKDKEERIDRDELLVSFINNQSTKNRLDIQSEELSAQIQRAYLTMLQRPATAAEIEAHIKTTDGFKVIVGRILRLEEYQNRFNANTLISDFVFTTTDNPTLLTSIIPTITGNNIKSTLPFNVTLTALRPQITIPEGATIAPKPNTRQDFTSPVTYTVTAVNGETRHYIVTLQNEIKFTEMEVLRKIYDTNPQSQSLLAWDFSNTDLSTWKGIKLTDGKISELNLSNIQLTSIPPEIGQLNRLTKLELGFNELSELPTEIGNLHRLEYLNLKSNRLSSLPIGIKGLTQLNYLNVSVNNLKILPSEIGFLSKLQKLHLENNEITSLPMQIGQLSALESLVIENNKIQTIPSQFGQLSSLKFLNIENNEIAAIPYQIGQLTRLFHLNLDTNNIKAIPSQIGQLRSLQFLSLENNEIAAIPSQIGQLRSLQFLHLQNNEITTIPSEIGQLTELIQLQLDKNKIEAIPPEIGQLITLTWLSLGDNKLRTIPTEIGQLTRLEWFSLGENQLTVIPPEIGNFTKLNTLYLNKNQFTSVPPEIGLLIALRSLNLSVNQLHTLPPEIGQLTALKSLILNSNQFETLPEVIGQLTTLTRLHATFNPLTSVPQAICDLQIPDVQFPSGNNFCN